MFPSLIVRFLELKFNDNFLMRGVITAAAGIEFFFSVISLYSLDFNLNVSRYVNTLPEEQQIDVEKCLIEIKNLKEKRKEMEKLFEDNLNLLGYTD